jgi:type I restriction enzyme M protein
MSGLENLIQNGHLDPSNPSTLKFTKFGSFGYLNLGGTTLKTLSSYLHDINPARAEVFTPTKWRRPRDIGDSKPDALITKASSVVAVVEYKSPGAITRKRDREGALEQLYTYVLATGSQVGVVTDKNVTYWLHDLDPKRRHLIKEVKTFFGTYQETPTPKNLKYVVSHLDPRTDQLITPAAANPSHVARSVWQSVYIATRQSPEKCFQTFVELFMYKLLSDYKLLPAKNQYIDALVIDTKKFLDQYGQSQVEYYVEHIRDTVKKTVFPRLSTQRSLSGVKASRGDYVSTAKLIPTLDTTGGQTSIIDGHAFEANPRAYNEPFVTALRRLNQIESVASLDKTFKSRVYEQFLRRDPNATKVTGKYFTPRNIVKAVVQMANVSALPPNSIVCDPACGVGGFITESLLALEEKGVKTYREVAGEIKAHIKFIGLEHDESIVCLAKSNFLLHTIETFFGLSKEGKKNYSKLLADIFIHCHEEPTLGTLAHPVKETFDLIMANPPYVVSGTKDITKKIKDHKDLALFYDGGGSGLESRFVNWIVNALRPGGRAFIILPKSMMARTEKNIKELILKKCSLDALIYLPPQCFYTAPLETYIVAITKKHETLFPPQQEPVFAYFVREIGETRDTRREPTDSDLPDMVKQFKTFMADRETFTPNSTIAKVVPISLLSPGARWDVDYLWTTAEREELGVVDLNTRSCDAIIEMLNEVGQSLKETKSLLDQSTTGVTAWRTVGLSDTSLFKIHRGGRVTEKFCKEHPGSVIVIASGRHKNSYFGLIDEQWLKHYFDPEGEDENIIFTPDRRILTVGATGSVGRVHMRDEEKWFLHDDALAVELLSDELDTLFCRYALQAAIDESHFDYAAKLYRERLTSIEFRIPVDEDGNFDYERQKELAGILSTKENTEMTLRRLSESLRGTEISVPLLT